MLALPGWGRRAREGDAARIGSFQRKTLLVFAVSVLGATLVVTAFLYSDLRRATMADLVRHQEGFAQALARTLEREIAQARRALEFLAAQPPMARLPHTDQVDPAINGIPPDVDPDKRRLLDQFLSTHPFSAVFVLLPDGDHYLSHPYSLQRRLSKFNLSDRDYFREARRTREPVISDSFVGADGELAVAIDVPVLDGEGDIRAHVGGVLHLERLSRLVAPSRIGPYSAAMLLDGDGHLIAHSEPRWVEPAHRQRFAEHPLLPGGAGGTPERMEGAVRTRVYRDPLDGERYVGTIRGLATGWCVVVTRSMDEVNALLYGQSLRTAGLVALLLLAVGGIGMLAVGRVARHWAAADDGLRAAHEDMEGQVRQRSADLVEANAALQQEVAERNAVQQELERHRLHLEELVAERARALVEANAALQREIAERERTEQALAEKDAHLRSVLNHAPIVVFATDRDGVITVSEGRGLLKRGRERGQAVGLSVFDVYLDRPDVSANIRRALTGEQFSWVVTVGGLHYESVYGPLRDEQGAIVGMIGVATDITERIRAEEALRRSRTTLARAQQIARIGSWEWDLATGAMVWSEEFYRLLALPPEAEPAYEAFLRHLDDADRGPVKTRIERLVDGTPFEPMEVRLLRREGPPALAELRAEMDRDARGRPARLLATLHDVTARRAAESELQEVARRLSHSNRELQELAYMTSHDLKEPAHTIRGLGERLLARPEVGATGELREGISRMVRSTERMQELIEQVLSLSRVATHAQPFVEVELGAVARQVVNDLEARLEDTGGRVELGDLPTVEADPLQMRQLLQNLVGNALKHRHPHRSPVVRLEALPGCDDSGAPLPGGRACYRLRVIDNGVGFDAAAAETLFLPFQRLRPAHGDSHGIGLAICRRIVERHGGFVQAEGTPGEGAVFTVTLPRHPPDTPAEWPP